MPDMPHARRLGDTLRPHHYAIDLTVAPDAPDFGGKLVLDAELTAPQRELVVHGRDLDVHSAHVRCGDEVVALTVTCEAADECLVFRPDKSARLTTLPAGPLCLEVAYRGRLAASMHGLYLAKDGPEVALVSQCEASDARSILPCLDEPAHKATFAWTVHAPKGLTVIANGEQEAVSTKGGITTHAFAATAKMSTYLLAVTVGHFEQGASGTVAGVPCRIWAGRGKGAQTQFALDITARVLPWYIDYFQAPYAYHKLDQVAVPGFDAGAMENSGAIFYRQSLLLLEPKNPSRAAQKRIAEVIAHEIAHQWFGNLVTMKWWDDLWLNEAFATWIAFKVCDTVRPEWEIWLDYLDAKEAALAADALATTHPIYAPVHNPAQATELFDVITYEKGCGVLRMAERYIGPDAFREGIRRYIDENQFGNAEGRDLWRHLAEASGEPIGDVMAAWVKQPGFPLIDCKLQKRGAKSVLHVSQSRFHDGAADAKEAHWPVPMVVAYDDGHGVQHARYLLQAKQGEVPLPTAAGRTVQWAYANAEASGFYRLRNDAALDRAVLADAHRKLPTSDRMALLNDRWALMRAGYAGVHSVLDAVVALAADPHPAVVRVAASRLRTMANHLVDGGEAEAEADRRALRLLCDQLFSGALRALEPADLRRKRPAEEGLMLATLVELVGGLARHPQLLAHLRNERENEERDPAALDANVAGSVVALAAIGQPVAFYRHLLRVYAARKQRGDAPEWTGRYLSALCMAEEGEPLAFVLSACLNGSIPQEQLRTVVSSLLSRRKSGPATWKWLRQHWARIAPMVGAMGIARLVEATGALPQKMHNEVQRFFAAHPVPEAQRAVQKSAEAMALWQRLRDREAPALHEWLTRWHQARIQRAAASTSAKKPARK